VSVVGDAIDNIDDLRFKEWTAGITEFPTLGGIGAAAVRDECPTDLERQIQTGKIGIALLKFIHPAETEQIVVEPTMSLEALIEGGLTGVPKRRVADIVGKGDGFGEVLVQAEPTSHGPGDLRDLQSVCQPGPVVIVDRGDENLRLAGHPAEGGTVDDPLPVTLVERSERMFIFRVPPAAAHPGSHRVRSQPRILVGEPVSGREWGVGHRQGKGAWCGVPVNLLPQVIGR